MALGALTILEGADAIGPIRFLRCNLVGDATYASGGSAGLLAKLRTLTQQANLNILAVIDQGGGAAPLSRMEYDHANEKLFARVKTTGAESAVANQSGDTYNLLIICA